MGDTIKAVHPGSHSEEERLAFALPMIMRWLNDMWAGGGDPHGPALFLWVYFVGTPEPRVWMVTVDEECVLRVDWRGDGGPVRDVAVVGKDFREVAVWGGESEDEMEKVYEWEAE